jgi:glycosyltransferase involved in cell wall biosynthesis
VARPRVFHILWNNKYESIDRVCLMVYYRALGKRVVLTAHNVNAAKRDGRDTRWNRFTLRVQYRLCHHLFVHTPRMRDELHVEFGITLSKITVIPFGINNTSPTTALSRDEARTRLGLGPGDRTLLFFGQIAPYKGLEYLVEAMGLLADRSQRIHLIVAGKIKQGHEQYWSAIERMLGDERISPRVVRHVRFIRDDEVELYFKASDALALPYVSIFQSGVPFLAYSFGLPVIATDVGSLRDDIIEGKTGFIARPCDPGAIADAISRYFSSDLYLQLESTKGFIQQYANDHHSWTNVGMIAKQVYEALDQ